MLAARVHGACLPVSYAWRRAGEADQAQACEPHGPKLARVPRVLGQTQLGGPCRGPWPGLPATAMLPRLMCALGAWEVWRPGSLAVRGRMALRLPSGAHKERDERDPLPRGLWPSPSL